MKKKNIFFSVEKCFSEAWESFSQCSTFPLQNTLNKNVLTNWPVPLWLAAVFWSTEKHHQSAISFCLLEGFLSVPLTEVEIWSLPDSIPGRPRPHKKVVSGGVCYTIFLPKNIDSFASDHLMK